MSIVSLSEATGPDAGGKAAALSVLVRAGYPVPAGIVVTADAYRSVSTALDLHEVVADSAAVRSRVLRSQTPADLAASIARALVEVTDGAPSDYVAVRSSATTEDGPCASTAGQHDSVLAVRGAEQVCHSIRTGWASLWTDRAVAYRTRRATTTEDGGIAMAVLVQRFIDADVSGVMFIGTADGTSVVEASWGLGTSVVAGQVTPDLWRVTDAGIAESQVGSKAHRSDRFHDRLVTREVPVVDRGALCLPDETVLQLHVLGKEVAATLQGPTDIEWAIRHGSIWVLQARPMTAVVPNPPPAGPLARSRAALAGLPASPGVVTGAVRIVSRPRDFSRVRSGDVLVCRGTDPAWTPLFSIASAVVTETGGVLSHAAIVAREIGIPAVLSVPQATTALAEPNTVTVDGNDGLIIPARAPTATDPPPSAEPS